MGLVFARDVSEVAEFACPRTRFPPSAAAAAVGRPMACAASAANPASPSLKSDRRVRGLSKLADIGQPLLRGALARSQGNLLRACATRTRLDPSTLPLAARLRAACTATAEASRQPLSSRRRAGCERATP